MCSVKTSNTKPLVSPETDLSWTIYGIWCQFWPNTKAGEAVWNEMHTQGVTYGKVHTRDMDALIQKLKDAGYTVSEQDTTQIPSAEEIMAEIDQLSEEEMREFENMREELEAFVQSRSAATVH